MATALRFCVRRWSYPQILRAGPDELQAARPGVGWHVPAPTHTGLHHFPPSQNKKDRQRLGDALEEKTLCAFPVQPVSIGSHGATRVSFHPTTDANTTEVTVRHTFTARFAEGQNFSNEGGCRGVAWGRACPRGCKRGSQQVYEQGWS